MNLRHHPLFLRVVRRIDRSLNATGFTLTTKGQDYFDAKTVVPLANASGLSLCEYLESNDLGGVGRRRDDIITQLTRILPSELPGILEIGAGTGIFLEKILDSHRPRTCEIYETSLDWCDYPRATMGNRTQLTCHNADGRSLRQTADASADAAFAHGVFVYLPVLVSFPYLEEMARVTKSGGWITFDCFVAEEFRIESARKWLGDPHGYTFPVLVPRVLIDDFAASVGLTLVAEFDAPYHATRSTYFVFQKAPPHD